MVEDRRVVGVLRLRMDDVSEADIDLRRYACTLEVTGEAHSNPLVDSVLLDHIGGDRRWIEHEAVVSDFDLADLSDDIRQVVREIVDVTEQIDVSRGPSFRRAPDPQHESTLQNE